MADNMRSKIEDIFAMIKEAKKALTIELNVSKCIGLLKDVEHELGLIREQLDDIYREMHGE